MQKGPFGDCAKLHQQSRSKGLHYKNNQLRNFYSNIGQVQVCRQYFQFKKNFLLSNPTINDCYFIYYTLLFFFILYSFFCKVQKNVEVHWFYLYLFCSCLKFLKQFNTFFLVRHSTKIYLSWNEIILSNEPLDLMDISTVCQLKK